MTTGIGRRWCRSCHAARMRHTRPKHSELSQEERLKANARAMANVYQKRGHLVTRPCEVCGTTDNIEKHHDDYSKPLAVRWLCREHHNTSWYSPPTTIARIPDDPQVAQALLIHEKPSSHMQAIVTLTEIDRSALEPSLHDIMRAVSAVTGISMVDLTSIRQEKRVVRARFIYFHLARTLTSKSFPQIGYYCGLRHHATVMNGLHRARQRWADIEADVSAVAMRLQTMCRSKE